MFYRRKIILALLQLFGSELNKIRLQTLLFLFTQKQTKKAYDFVPSEVGCYSFSADADLTALASKGLVHNERDSVTSKSGEDYVSQLTNADHEVIESIRQEYGTIAPDALTKYVYVKYPYWTTKSTKAESILSEPEYTAVRKCIATDNTTVLFTIGYEGISLEEYFNRLIRSNVKVLVDVRNNPLSMKYGFSKSPLKRFCENLGISYVHLPEVGIRSAQRSQLKQQSDYDNLFMFYRHTTLTQTMHTQHRILSLLQDHKRIALTCFEANICHCHRKHLAESIEKLADFRHNIIHI